jgi:hypothetical protein
MRSAVRNCITAGVAIAGVSVIIAAPSTPPLTDVQVPAVQLSGNTHENPDVNSPSVVDLLQVMGGSENPVVVQNITESGTGVFEGDTPAAVPGLSDLLNLGGDPGAVTDPQGKALFDLGPLVPGVLTPVPAGPPPTGG